MKKNMIWSYDTSSWNEDEEREIYEECCGGEPSEQELQDYIYDTNQTYLEDEEINIQTHEKIHGQKQYIVLADCGLWYGRRDGGKIITGLWNAISQCFEDYNEIYEEGGRLKITAHHHDGTNYFQIKELTKRGEEFAERHEWDMDDRKLHKKLFNDSHYSRNVRAFKEIYGW